MALVSLSSPAALGVALVCAFALGIALKAPRFGTGALPWVLPFGAVMALVLPFATPGPAALHVQFGTWSLVASSPGLVKAEVFLLRLVAIALATGILLGVTTVPQILDGLRTLRTPSIFVDLVGFIMRYASVLSDEAKRMTIAREARGLTRKRGFFAPEVIRAYGQMLGVLFERAYERSERLYLAMLSRSYGAAHETRRGRFTTWDWAWFAVTAGASLVLILLDRRLTV
jgi:cobalt/nickel transport system permease protein